MRRGNLVLASDSPALHTDQYELGNLQGAIRSGVASRLAVFELFARRLPEGRRYGVFAGLGRLLDRLENFRFTADQLCWLNETQVADADTRGRLEGQHFTGDVWAYQEGDLYFPNSPLLTVVAPFAEAVLLETLCLSICNWDSGIASSASRMVTAARGLPITEMGSRRTHEEAAIDAARAAYIAGFSATSNMEAGYRYGIPVTGTAAHCFTMAHRDELTAFRAQVASQGPETTLLVDTYDLEQGIRNAVAAAGPELGGVRIDSGDLLSELPKARRLLNSLGARQARIVLTGGLDEYAMDELSLGAAGGFGSGERLIAHPSPGFVYKLVAIADSDDGEQPLRRVSKRSASKLSLGGRKWAYRRFDASRFIIAEDLVVSDSAPESPPVGLPLQERVVGEGRILLRRSVEEARAFHQQAKCQLSPEQLSIQSGPPAIVARPTRTREESR
ncbi:MAG: nicotinate phosphoribosyltransferase [Candidatus Dormibacteraeota bacterium]|nr:nicotinate phosphoribosyltransferase [Candidatus Dormibacteraeota bacterium]